MIYKSRIPARIIILLCNEHMISGQVKGHSKFLCAIVVTNLSACRCVVCFFPIHSIGIESVEDLIKDLEQALANV